MSSKLILLVGPTCVGKTRTINELIKDPNYKRLVTCTTRARRDEEIDGISYHFFSNKEFEAGLKNNAFIEHAKVHGKYYGVNHNLLLDSLNEGKTVLGIVDIQGARTFKRILKDDVAVIFIAPKNTTELTERFKADNRDEDDLKIRLRSAIEEMGTIHDWDYSIINETNEFSSFLKRIKKLIKKIEKGNK